MSTALSGYLQLFLILAAIIGTAIGSIAVARRNAVKLSSDNQENTVRLLNDEINSLVLTVARNEKDIARMKRILATVRFALKRRGLIITLNGDYITFYDVQSRSTSTLQLRTTQQQTSEDTEARDALTKEGDSLMDDPSNGDDI